MQTCVIESPYAGEIDRNIKYLERCIKFCAYIGLAPYASHKMMTVALDDLNPAERILGIDCGLTYRRLVDRRIFFIDYDYSSGMNYAKDLYGKDKLSWDVIKIGKNDETPKLELISLSDDFFIDIGLKTELVNLALGIT